ncbi:hypothetical protein CP49_37100 [Bradyrhizobium valentinum]|uniref:Uncharacterized protein n=1 Tax=Bradyrhizobium valentinum TaxID=1518501 RepID=A0A0R3KMW3_9BRAD|nr:hypothetical protein CP49_37100 [Bradyrhizobium valentinum]
MINMSKLSVVEDKDKDKDKDRKLMTSITAPMNFDVNVWTLGTSNVVAKVVNEVHTRCGSPSSRRRMP